MPEGEAPRRLASASLAGARRGARFRFLCHIGGAGLFSGVAKMAILLRANRESRSKAVSGQNAKDYARPALNKVMLGELIDLVIRAN